MSWAVEGFKDIDLGSQAASLEALRLSTVERLERAMAWKIDLLMRLGRTCSDLDAALLVRAGRVAGGLYPESEEGAQYLDRHNDVVHLTDVEY
ncbi:MAG: hypothetical protein Q8Q28_13245 [Pseudomonadota bacterium]|nr:hypothetical protein [Pseudomonadota bacterium]